MNKGQSETEIRLPSDEALVFFELLSRWDDNGKLEVLDRSDELVLLRLLGRLETVLVDPLKPEYRAILEAARKRLQSEAG